MAKRQGSSLSEEKFKKIAVGGTVAGVLLFLCLFVILIVQFVQIGVRKKIEAELDREKARYEQLIAEGYSQLEIYETEQGLYELALKYGWITPSGK